MGGGGGGGGGGWDLASIEIIITLLFRKFAGKIALAAID